MNLRGAVRLARRHDQTTAARKVALVTGAGNRLGRAIALALAERGWDIVVHYRHSEDDAELTALNIEALGRRALLLQCDLSDEAAVRALLPRTAAFGPLTCLVNNAALVEHGDAAGFSVARLDAQMHVNLAAPVLLAQALHAMTPDGAQAVVVNLLACKPDRMNPDFLSHALSRAALQSATAMLAQALAPRVRVVGVAPGIAPRSGSADVAAAVCYLAEAGAVTGATLIVDGGRHLLPCDPTFPAA
jgi:NAD(P)-dependent dehydrogenase (short-subunit alcohol dehydrogenase family)